MKRLLVLALPMLALSIVPVFSGCDKEKVVNSTEYIEKYVEGPTDTVTVHHTDTVVVHDTTSSTITDTVVVRDTVSIHDTITVTQHHYDTTVVTVTVTDTVHTIVNHYDTVTVTNYQPSAEHAYTALQAHNDPMVIDFAYSEFGYNDGWVFYLSAYQVDLQQNATGVYSIYGYIDYWAPDWSGYYPLEFYWTMSYQGGDPADPNNWSIAEPTAASPHEPGIRLANDPRRDYNSTR